jgi:hypothetical protein
VVAISGVRRGRPRLGGGETVVITMTSAGIVLTTYGFDLLPFWFRLKKTEFRTGRRNPYYTPRGQSSIGDICLASGLSRGTATEW